MSRLSGLSPLARGNHLYAFGTLSPDGPIPARAGQPSFCHAQALGFWAYPRSRGATALSPASVLSDVGLSPLARGNRSERASQFSYPGPIPARAGQPRIGVAGQDAQGAYPRSRGATQQFHGAAQAG